MLGTLRRCLIAHLPVKYAILKVLIALADEPQ